MTSIKVIQANNSNLDEWLNLQFKLFNVNDLHVQNMVRIKYNSALDATKFIELYISGEKIGHVSCIKQRMYIGSVVSNVAFLTSVYIFPKFRGNGYLLPLLNAAEEIATAQRCIATIIVARRAVGKMYSKFGYFGFSVFPSVNLGQNEFKLRKNLEWEVPIKKIQFNESYTETYSIINGTLVRNLLYWESIKYAIEHGLFELLVDIPTKSYILKKKSTAIEVAGSVEGLVKLLHSYNFEQLLISKDHNFFKTIIFLGGQFQQRPEPKEGHLIKIFNKKSDFGKSLLTLELSDSNLEDENFKPMNLLELNQW
jgi:predicted acetyltransferase